MKFRHEYKFFINYSDYLTLRSRLGQIMKMDKNVGNSNEYKIRSLYFDNIYDKALNEKINGFDNREKFRIRCYNNDFTFIKLEKKSKINGLCNKVSCPITKEECIKILNNDLDWMLNSKFDLIKELYIKMKTQLLKPKVLVDYTREPFIYEAGNVRITLDRNIKTGMNEINLFNLESPTIIAGESLILVEVKYDEYLPEIIKKTLNLKNRTRTSYSKYEVCRIFG